MADLNLERELDNLFAAPVAEFIHRRNELSGRLRGAGRGRDAEHVAKLEKPSVVAWAANYAVIQGRPDYEALAAASEALRRAQAEGARMGDANERQRQAREKLLKRARQALNEVGHAVTPAVLKKIGGTLQALATRAIGSAPGRMVRELAPPGFEALAGLVSAAKATGADAERSEAKRVFEDARGAVRVAEARRERLGREHEAAERLRLQAAERVEAASQALARAHAQAGEAEARAAEAATELTRADADLAVARRRFEDLS